MEILDRITLTKPVEGFPAGTPGTVMTMLEGGATVELQDDRPLDFSCIVGVPFDAMRVVEPHPA